MVECTTFVLPSGYIRDKQLTKIQETCQDLGPRRPPEIDTNVKHILLYLP